MQASSHDGPMTDLMQTIDGRGEPSPASFDVVDPSTARPFARSPDASADQLERAVAAARRAFATWSELGWERRGETLRRFAAALRQRSEELARLLTLEQGKPLAESRTEILRAADNADGYSHQQVPPRVLRDDAHERIEEHFRPAGVAAVISPWNSPVSLFMLRAGPLLQSGSTVVAKPSPYTPLTTLRLGEIGREVFPPGVLNVIAGLDPLGQHLVEHPGVDRVSFTGSVATGKRVMASAAATLKRVGLELGGNDAAILLDDVDVEAVAPQLLWAALRNCGQICMAVKRIYAPASIHEAVVEAVGRHARAVRMGPGVEEGVQLGPLQNEMQFGIVRRLLEETRALPGVRVVAGGSVGDGPGYFVQPTVLADLPDDARLVQEEQFGPLVPILRYRSVDEAVERANASRFGLSASVWSRDPTRARQVAARLQVGTVWINQHMVLDPDTPFGGWKESGLGRGNGQTGLIACLESQVIRTLKAPATA